MLRETKILAGWRVFRVLHLAKVPTLLRFATAQPTFHGHSHFLIQYQLRDTRVLQRCLVEATQDGKKRLPRSVSDTSKPDRTRQVVWPPLKALLNSC